MIRNKFYLIFITIFSIFIVSISISCNKQAENLKNNDTNIDLQSIYVDDDYNSIPKNIRISVSCDQTIGRNTYVKVQDAIDEASPGSKIYISEGIYNENINIAKSLDIIGSSVNNTIIKGTIKIVNKSSEVNISNLELTNGLFQENNRGIYNNGVLNICCCIISGNKYDNVGAYILNDSGILTINDSTIYTNRSNHGGGGIFNIHGILNITYSNIYGNVYFPDDVDFCNLIAINATYNWWGDPTGPYNKNLNPNGKGGKISDNISFIPWYIDETMSLTSQTLITK
jgi:hypothetical protein